MILPYSKKVMILPCQYKEKNALFLDWNYNRWRKKEKKNKAEKRREEKKETTEKGSYGRKKQRNKYSLLSGE